MFPVRLASPLAIECTATVTRCSCIDYCFVLSSTTVTSRRRGWRWRGDLMRFCYQYNFSGGREQLHSISCKDPSKRFFPPTLERHVERHDILHSRVMSLQEAIRESINIVRIDSSVLLLLPVGADLDRAAWIRDFQELILTCSRPVHRPLPLAAAAK